MSHAATNWAIQQRGLKPTTKIVLWHLCDRFNPDFGCFPSQEQLAHDCEISRSTLNDHLTLLESAGLIRRVQRLNPGTKRQMPTRYILAFEPGFTQDRAVPGPKTGHGFQATHTGEAKGSEITAISEDKPVDNPHPCPENADSRVRNPDSNLVREPVSKPVKEEEDAQAREIVDEEFFGSLLSALGFAHDGPLPGWWQGWPPREHVRRWQTDLGLTDAEILEAAEASRQEHPEPPDGPKALDRIMQRAAQRKADEKSRGRRKARKPSKSENRPITDLPVFYAEMVNSDRYLPVSAISNSMRDAMLARGLVTVERLRERGIR
ncbi:helix-turn-helix domain-containing protein [Thalassobacter stenotrophicus]|uniref:helix-turn-helix domain-containing protein n=1 Tax=Thalassobacter stenotrophicus TaxID=266809 RepID=UPI000D5CDCD2|nr:helix-turn-helix domain-containing protein [Thalassobacter stenotrophicus]PVZ48693.1 GntR family transcriptional regulator [Thalassobacter stenotrophicus]